MIQALKEFFPNFMHNNLFLVGGTARDFILKKTPDDVDILLTKTNPDELIKLGFNYIDPKTAYPVFSIHHEILGKIEVALPRTEKKIGEGHTGFEVKFDPDLPLEVDLNRRDFTINSFAIHLKTNEVFDPFTGIADLNRNILRETNEKAFKEDYLRVYRACRFACKGFVPTVELSNLIIGTKEEYLPVERVYTELMKAMKEDYPERFFTHLLSYNIGKDLFKEIYAMQGVPAGPVEYHPEGDVLEHSLDVLEKASKQTKDPKIRLACFLHDLGKITTPKEKWPHHHDHDQNGIKVINTFLSRLKADKKTIELCELVCEEHMRLQHITEFKPAKILRIADKVKSKENLLVALYTILLVDSGRQYYENLADYLGHAIKIAKMNVIELKVSEKIIAEKDGSKIKGIILEKRIHMLKNALRSINRK